MFDIGFWELLLIFSLGLVILGPERLPRVAAQIGNWAGQARRMANMLMTQLRTEIDLEERGRSGPPPRPEPRSWNRPGVDDLKPGNSKVQTAQAGEEGAGSSPAQDTAADDPAGGPPR
ncbi:MAG: twin-arginine translocase subunit TatB [Chromatiales bacterium]|nr:twin-arginine translocase subunit TatB [Chromatiales bacterium]